MSAIITTSSKIIAGQHAFLLEAKAGQSILFADEFRREHVGKWVEDFMRRTIELSDGGLYASFAKSYLSMHSELAERGVIR